MFNYVLLYSERDGIFEVSFGKITVQWNGCKSSAIAVIARI